jgi:hypothetical protein
MSFRLFPEGRTPADRGRSRPRTRRGAVRWAIEELEHRTLLSGSPTNYTVNLTSDTGATSGTDATTGYPSGDLLWAVAQANSNTNPAGSVIEFDPTVFNDSGAGPIGTITTKPLELTETAGPEVIEVPQTPSTILRLLAITGTAGSLFHVDSGVTAVFSGLDLSGDSRLGGGDGGAIDNQGTLTVNDCFLNGAATDGGAIYNSGYLTLNQVNVVSSDADLGGGIYNSGTLKIADSVIDGNSYFIILSFGSSPPICGGGIYNLGTLTAVNSTIVGNISGQGGAIYSEGGTLTIVNCTIAYNGLSYSNYDFPNGGGGVDIVGGTVVLDNSIVALNSAMVSDPQSGGGGVMANGPPLDIVGALSPASAHNLIGTGGSGGLQNGINGNLVDVADPGLESLDAYSGDLLDELTPDLSTDIFPGFLGGTEAGRYVIALASGSPAIAAGSVALAVDPTTGLPLTTDERGAGFPRTFNNSVDIGAYESFSRYVPPQGGSGSTGSSPSSAPLEIVGELVLTAGNGKHKHVSLFDLLFSGALDASRAGNAADYDVTQTVKHRRKTISQRVKIKARYNSASHEVSLILSGSPSFALGGQLVVNALAPDGITSTSGVYLDGSGDDAPGSNAVFVILPNGEGLTR